MNFFRVPFFFPWLAPNLLWRVKTNSKELYLTFDDGPVSGPTEFVLDTLEQFHVKATFFCIGDNVRKYPAIFQRVIQEGHAVGNHTFNHLNGWKSPDHDYIANVSKCSEQISSFLNPGSQSLSSNAKRPIPKLFRPPYGKITPKQIRALNYKIVMWDVLTNDFNKDVRPDRCLSSSIKATRPGSVIVFHDSYKAEKNMMYTLPKYIEHFKERGFNFLPLMPRF